LEFENLGFGLEFKVKFLVYFGLFWFNMCVEKCSIIPLWKRGGDKVAGVFFCSSKITHLDFASYVNLKFFTFTSQISKTIFYFRQF